MASWPSTLLTVAPFIASALVMLLGTLKSPAFRIAPVTILGLVTSFVTVRELVRGRRPVWLSTWMAAAMACVSTLIHFGVAVTSSSSILVTPRAHSITGLLLTAGVLVAALLMRKWRLPAVIFATAYGSCATYLLWNGPTENVMWIPLFLGFPLILSVTVMLASLVFAFHPYADGTRGALFLVAILSLRFPFERGIELWSLVCLLLTGVVAIEFVRSPLRESKKSWLGWACVAVGLGVMQPGVWHEQLIGTVVSYFLFVLVVAPLICMYVSYPIFFDEQARQAQIEPPAVVQ